MMDLALNGSGVRDTARVLGILTSHLLTRPRTGVATSTATSSPAEIQSSIDQPYRMKSRKKTS